MSHKPEIVHSLLICLQNTSLKSLLNDHFDYYIVVFVIIVVIIIRATIVQHQRVPVRGRGKDQLVNGVVEKPFDIQQHRNDLSSHQMNTNGVWSIHQQNNLVGDENSTVIDGQSVLTATTTRQMSPDNFMTGGVSIYFLY